MQRLKRSRLTSSVSRMTAVIFLVLCSLQKVVSFVPRSLYIQKTMFANAVIPREFPSLRQTEYNDFSSGEAGEKEEEEEARLLAQQFYQQMKIRDKQKGNESGGSTSNISSSTPSLSSQAPKSSFDSVEETYSVSPPAPTKRTKFTGRTREVDSTGTPSAGLFSRNNASVMAFPASSAESRSISSSSSRASTKERMMQQEFNLLRVASNETILILQMVGVLALLGFTVYVGLSGGITDGSDRFGDALNEYNGGMEVLDFRGSNSVENLIQEGTSSSTMSSSSDVWL